MTKTFCDKCGCEITPRTSGSIEPPIHFDIITTGGVAVRLDASIDPIINSKGEGRLTPDICRYCIIDAFVAMDDRPKAYA